VLFEGDDDSKPSAAQQQQQQTANNSSNLLIATMTAAAAATASSSSPPNASAASASSSSLLLSLDESAAGGGGVGVGNNPNGNANKHRSNAQQLLKRKLQRNRTSFTQEQVGGGYNLNSINICCLLINYLILIKFLPNEFAAYCLRLNKYIKNNLKINYLIINVVFLFDSLFN
jgi:hypothetical protein